MSAFLPSSTVTVLRGVSTDAYGDEADDNDTAIAERLPVLITEKRQRSYQPAEGRGGTAETFMIRLRPGVDVVEGDRLRDEHTSAIYQVREVSNPSPVIGLVDVRVTAVRISAQSQAVNA